MGRIFAGLERGALARNRYVKRIWLWNIEGGREAKKEPVLAWVDPDAMVSCSIYQDEGLGTTSSIKFRSQS